jgi:hypothetical protein
MDHLYADRWRRDPEDFAVRFPLRAPKGAVHNGVQVDEGTRAFLMVNGKHQESLQPGYHVLTSFFERLLGLGRLGEHSWAMLVNAGPQVVGFPFAGLRDSEQVPLTAVLRLQLQLRDPERFLERVMIHRDRCTNDDLVALVGPEISEVVQKRASEYRLETLMTDVAQREAIERTLRPEMERILELYGLEFTSVRLASLGGPEVERLRNRLGDKAVQIRDWEIDRELRSLERDHRLTDLEGEHGFADMEAKLSHEFGLKDAERAKIRALWDQQAARDLARDRRRGDQDFELDDIDHEIAKAQRLDRLTKLKGKTGRDEDLEDLELLRATRNVQMETLAAQARLDGETKDAEARRKLLLAQGLSGLTSQAIAAASPGERDVLDALVKLDAIQRGASEDQRLQGIAQAALPAVALLCLTSPDGDSVAFGTGWMLGPRVLATNAHVAVDARQAIEQGLRCWAVFGGAEGNRNARVEQVVIHPKYGDAGPGPAGKRPAVPPYDVALMVLDSDQQAWLPLAPPEKLSTLAQGTRVAYLGYPMEDMAGGGVNTDRPEPIMKSGIIAAMGDWWLGRADPSQQLLIQHDLGVAGGASGSPLLDTDGQVVGIVSAGNMAAGIDVTSGKVKRIPSGVMLNFAQRIDLLGELLARKDEEAQYGL